VARERGALEDAGVTTRTAAAALLLAAFPAAGQVGGAGAPPDPSQPPPPAGTAAPPAQPPEATAAGSPGPPPRAQVAVPGGTFRAGERVGPLGDTTVYVKVGPFLLDATEVTVSEYGACVRAGRCTPAWTTVRWYGLPAPELGRWSSACNGARPDRADHPANCVDWFQAQAFCAWEGKRLPTEAEWEWAARGGAAATAYPWGNAPPADRACWSGEGNGAGGPRHGTCRVGTHPGGGAPSGVQDLAGNVWEWTSTPEARFTDSRGRGGSPGRIARGGGWGDAVPGQLSAARRAKDSPDDRGADLGFRCARSR
jgi:formylglycine-generating enzyme required for sulfatase activity